MDVQDIDEEPNVHFYPNNAMDEDDNDLEADTNISDDGKDDKDGDDNNNKSMNYRQHINFGRFQ